MREPRCCGSSRKYAVPRRRGLGPGHLRRSPAGRLSPQVWRPRGPRVGPPDAAPLRPLHARRLLRGPGRPARPGGKVVAYTVNRWSPVSLAAKAIPFGLHHAFKRALWRTEERDTFPVAYRMNTRGALRRAFGAHGFREAGFAYLDDCRT